MKKSSCISNSESKIISLHWWIEWEGVVLPDNSSYSELEDKFISWEIESEAYSAGCSLCWLHASRVQKGVH